LMGVDLCVLRHPQSVIRDLAEYLPEMTFINAGEGSISHPTQALIDLMTIIEKKGSIDDLNILIVGDLDHSRVTSSFIEAISNFSIEELATSKSMTEHPRFLAAISKDDFVLVLGSQKILATVLSGNKSSFLKDPSSFLKLLANSIRSRVSFLVRSLIDNKLLLMGYDYCIHFYVNSKRQG